MYSTAQFGVLWGCKMLARLASDLASELKQFRGFLHSLAFPVFYTRFLNFFSLNTQISMENIYRINKTNCSIVRIQLEKVM
jgi:hypothetical protein